MEFVHYFNYVPATIPDEEQEIFYRHPTLPFCVNQLGAIFEDEGYSVNYVKDKDIRLFQLQTNKPIATGRRTRLILECYLGEVIGLERKIILFLDGNPMNYGINNIKLREDLTIKQLKEALENKDRYKDLSIEHLKKLERRVLEKGFDTNRYFKFMRLPNWLGKKFTLQKKSVCGTILTDKLPSPKNYQRMLEIVKMYEDGVTQKEIMEHFGFSSRTVVRYWILKYEMIEGKDIYKDK